VIEGTVTADGEAIVPLVVLDADGREHSLECVIDTGFSGSLTLPPELIATFGLAWLGRSEGMLADGSLHEFNLYAATILWDDRPRTIETDAADIEPLIGMALLRGYKTAASLSRAAAPARAWR
jgi:clan AA aspartic protease